LDDLGKERATGAGLEYLYQIINFRYLSDYQTIITTNAADQDELVKWSDADYFVPLLSRLNEKGVWCAIKKAGDYRNILGETKKLPVDAA
jgi:DNA replication protein DnaC